MPVYEYSCPKCGIFEYLLLYPEKEPIKCPTCGSKIKKIISLSNFTFKGTGWYTTDYKIPDKNKRLRKKVKDKYKDKYNEYWKPEVKIKEEK